MSTTSNSQNPDSILDERVESDTQAAVEAGQRIGRPVTVGEGLVAILNPVTGESEIHDVQTLETAREAVRPLRKRGGVTLRDAASFAGYVDRHGSNVTELWADLEKRSVLAILNGDGDHHENAGHRDHRATLSLRFTTAWEEWKKRDGLLLTQEQFAEFIEARQIDVHTPAGGDLLQIVTTIKATKSVDFESAKRLSDGQTVFEYRETVNASAGKAGTFEIPETFILGIAPFEGSPLYRVLARLRYRIDKSDLKIGFVLDRPKDYEETAFGDVLTAVNELLSNDDEETRYPIFTGWPSY